MHGVRSGRRVDAAPPTSGPTPAPATARSGTAALGALILAVLAYSLPQTMLVPTLGVLQRDLDTSAQGASWAVLSAPLIVGAVLTPLISRLGDGYGRRRMLLITLAIYFLATLAACAAGTIGVLIALRAVQGVSLALLPLSLGLLRAVLPPTRVASALGITSGLVAGAAGAGLVGGGLIVDHLSWRWLFVAAAMLIAAAGLGVLRAVPADAPAAPAPLDLPGAALLGITLVCLLLGLTEGPSWGWTSGGVLGLFAAAIIAGRGFLVRESRAASPLIESRLLLGRGIRVAHAAAFLLGLTQFVFYVLIPRLAELPTSSGGFGRSVTVAGLILVPGTLFGLPASALVGRVEARFGARAPMVAGLACSAVGGALAACFHAELWQVVACYAVIGTGFGAAMGALPKLVHDTTGPAETATANGVNAVARTVGGAVGSQLATAILASHTTFVSPTGAPVIGGFGPAFWAATIASVLGVSVVLRGTESANAISTPEAH